jgi:hypothetical protein
LCQDFWFFSNLVEEKPAYKADKNSRGQAFVLPGLQMIVVRVRGSGGRKAYYIRYMMLNAGYIIKEQGARQKHSMKDEGSRQQSADGWEKGANRNW